MSKAAKPFAYRGKWRIQVTLKNGKRPAENFIKHADALQWAADTLGRCQGSCRKKFDAQAASFSG